jgi:zinc/manganese transport system substrate-binding protein
MIIAIVAAMKRQLLLLLPVLAAAALVAAAPGQARPAAGQIQVVAAENFWGSIAGQLGGDRVHVTSIIDNPATDPHDYEPNSVDARTIAGAQIAIVNGIGYDPWAPKLIAANPVSGRVVLTVGDIVGLKPGGNPHRWYSPPNVRQVAGTITNAYAKLDPKDATYFRAQKTHFLTKNLAEYNRLIATIKRKYHGVAVGASESIFAPLAQALGLNLITPYSFLKAISEGTEPTASDKTTINGQIAKHQIKVWVFNSQNSTPDVARFTEAARKQHIPVTTITETMTPASASFEQWQVRQLKALEAALHQATGR